NIKIPPNREKTPKASPQVEKWRQRSPIGRRKLPSLEGLREGQLPEKRMVEWYGQRMCSQASVASLKPFAAFSQYFCANSFATLVTYRDAILSSLQVGMSVSLKHPPGQSSSLPCTLFSCRMICRSYCEDCLNILAGPGTFDSLKVLDPWICYLCQPHQPHGALVPREDWRFCVQELFANNSAMEFKKVPLLLPFSGYLVLKDLGFKVEKYVASEVCEDSVAVATINHDGKIIHVGDVRFITEELVTKVRTITTNPNSLKQGKDVSLLPVMQNGREDILWITELEKIFGFPKHYTDARNMNRQQRQKLLGKAWSVPVIRHLFAPLKEYFACEELAPLATPCMSTSSSYTIPSSPNSPDLQQLR
ncbi:hypothetical protein GOODEAATRI_004675, partial [Goodea atripinnis]